MNDNMKEIAIAWYSPEEYELFKKAAEDPQHWHSLYEDWLNQFHDTESYLSLLGQPVLLVPMVYKKFKHWCKLNNAGNTSSDRARYVAMMNV